MEQQGLASNGDCFEGVTCGYSILLMQCVNETSLAV
jgi:hypothetical protein